MGGREDAPLTPPSLNGGGCSEDVGELAALPPFTERGVQMCPNLLQAQLSLDPSAHPAMVDLFHKPEARAFDSECECPGQAPVSCQLT